MGVTARLTAFSKQSQFPPEVIRPVVLEMNCIIEIG